VRCGGDAGGGGGGAAAAARRVAAGPRPRCSAYTAAEGVMKWLLLVVVTCGLSRHAVLQEQLPPFPNATAGTFFSGVFSDKMVLQRGPRPAVLFGAVVGASAGTTVSVKVSCEGNGSSYTVDSNVEVTPIRVQAGGLYARWRAALRPVAAVGGSCTLAVDCTSCGVAAGHGTAISAVTWGDVWVCSGQSNMELPLIHDHYRNGTMDAVLRGKYSTIRMLEMGKNKLRDTDDATSGHDHYVVPPAPPGGILRDGQMSAWVEPRVGAYGSLKCRAGVGPVPKDVHTPCPDCCSLGDWQSHNFPNKTTSWTYTPNEQWTNNTMWSFSSVCFNFAASLQDMQESRGEQVVPIGLIGSYWVSEAKRHRVMHEWFDTRNDAGVRVGWNHHTSLAPEYN
jgi:hypothetical protein